MVGLNGPQINHLIKSQAANAVKIHIRNLKDIYLDNWDEIIANELRQQFNINDLKDLYIIRTKELNLLKRVVNEISMLYKEPALRRVCKGESETEEIVDPGYAEVVDQDKLNVIMQQVNRYTNLTNALLLRVVWRDEKIDYDILTFDNCEIVTDPTDYKKIVGVKFYVGLTLPTYDQYIDDSSEGVGKFDKLNLNGTKNNKWFEEYTYAYLYTIEGDGTQGKIYKIKYEQGLEKVESVEDNPYRNDKGEVVLPFVLFTRNCPVDRLLDFTTGQDLIDLNLNTAVNMVHLNNLIKFQAWKQIYMLTAEPDKIPNFIGLAPNKVMVIPNRDNSSQVGTLDIQSNIQGLWQIILERVKTGLAQYGLDAESFQRSGNGESGFKLKVKKEGLLEIRRFQLPIYRDNENILFQVTKIVNNLHNTRKIGDGEFKIDFADMTFETDAESEARNWTVKISQNVATAIDWIMSENPDLDREEAEEIYKRNAEINRARMVQAAPFQAQPAEPMMDEEDEEEDTEEETEEEDDASAEDK